MADQDQDDDDDVGGGLGTTYDGLYTGFVVSNADPLRCGRVTVNIPSICNPSGWARPGSMAGMGGPGRGMWQLPKVGARVDVHFLMGDLKVPVWYPGQGGQGDLLTHQATPPRGGAVSAADMYKVWGWEGDRYAIQVDERPGNEYFKITDKMEPENNIEIDSLQGLVQMSAKTGLWLRCIGGAIVAQALSMTFNGRPLNNTTIEPL
jgi:Type VI secretion system/phage-baseplate injector OB domain